VPLHLHKKQGAAFLSEKKITLCTSGISGGKSSVGALWMLRQISKWSGPDHAFIVAGPSYKIMQQSTLPTFLKYALPFGEYKSGDAQFVLKSGAIIYFRTSTNPFSIEGIQNTRAIWLDEGGLCSYTFWINIEGRAARTAAPIIVTTTPYGMNWPYQSLIKPLREGKRNDVAHFEWLSIDNPSFPKEEYERQKQILDPRTFRRKYMGIHERMEGLVYEITDENFMEPQKLPKGTRFFAGVDFGFAEGHEFAVIIRAVTPDGYHYDIDEFKQAGMDPNQQVMLCRSKMDVFHVERFYCDPARPDMISALNKAGCVAAGFHIGNENYKQIVPGINKHIEFIRSGRYKIIRGACPHLEDEYETYHWPEYIEGSVVKEVPVAINDHLMDATRYVTIGTMNLKVFEAPKPFVSRSHAVIDRFDPTKTSKTKRSWEAY